MTKQTTPAKVPDQGSLFSFHDPTPRTRRRTDHPRDTPTHPVTPITMTIKETAAFLGLSLSATYEAAARGEIPTMKIGRRVLVKREQLISMVARH